MNRSCTTTEVFFKYYEEQIYEQATNLILEFTWVTQQLNTHRPQWSQPDHGWVAVTYRTRLHFFAVILSYQVHSSWFNIAIKWVLQDRNVATDVPETTICCYSCCSSQDSGEIHISTWKALPAGAVCWYCWLLGKGNKTRHWVFPIYFRGRECTVRWRLCSSPDRNDQSRSGGNKVQLPRLHQD